jgi:hypothetical protein
MRLHTLAKHVQEKGRGKDQMLVHMTPREVQGLQALAKAHGGSLTVNPETGLAEAGFLEQVLPIVAMAAATYFTAGAAAPALSAALGSSMAGGIAAGSLAGAGVGAIGAAAQDKDVGQGALYGGIGGAISGGMGAYGDANVLSGATPTPSPDVVNQVALDASVTGQIPGQSGAPIGDFAGSASDPTAGMREAANTGMPPTAPPSGAPIPPTAEGNAAAAQNLSQQQRVEALNKLAEAKGAGVTSNAYGSTPGPNAEQSLYQTQNAGKFGPEGNIYPDLKATPPPPGSEPSYYSTMGTPGKLMTQSLPGIGADIGMNTPEGPPGEEPYSSQSTLSADFQGYTPRQPKPYYQAQYTRYAAGGGLMALAEGGDPAKKKKQRASLTSDRNMAAMSADQAGLAMLNNARYAANMTGASPLSSMSLGDLPANTVAGARGGLADLGGYSDGGRMLKGPGDGMSDSIPAQIGRKQPARLADGEFVIPADVVSHLGNGSTDAGAKRLYAMMDRARQARTGKKKQAPAVNADKLLSRVA